MLLIDHNQIYIKDYIELMVIENYMIKVKMNGYCLNVRGSDLELYYYDYQEIRLNGHVKVIEYDESRV